MAGQQLANMRHFAAHPSGYYELTFPTENDVNDVALRVEAMLSTDDYMVLGIEYSGGYQVDQVYFTTYSPHFNFGFLDQPAGPNKQIYTPVANRQAVANAPNGQVYWHDTANDMIWVKMQGGANPTWNPSDYAENSDINIYRASYLRVMGSAALPVELEIFNARLNDEEEVELDWITLSEQNSDYFEVQRSADGVNWTSIEKVTAAGNSSERLIYQVVDNQPLSDVFYCCLKQVDIDGSVNYSDTKAIQNNGKLEVLIYPTIADNEVTIAFAEMPETDVEIAIYSLTGQLVSRRILDEKSEQMQLNIDDLNNGIYIISVHLNGQIHTQRLVKQK